MATTTVNSNGRYLLVTADVDAVLSRLSREDASPRQDFVELAHVLDATILSVSDVKRSKNYFVKLLHKVLGPAPALAWLGASRKGSYYFTTAENAGLFLSIFLRMRPQVVHIMIGHHLSAGKKRRLLKLARMFDRVTATICYNTAQVEFAKTYFKAPAERVHCIDFQVDEAFFTPAARENPRPRSILSVGRELRDYPTLLAALEETDVAATIIASSPWSSRKDETQGRNVPENVVLRQGLTSEELREAYRDAELVVVPLQDVDSPAGITSILEAQAVGRPVLVSATPGTAGMVEPGSTAFTVPCGDAAALKSAMLRLLDTPDETKKIALAGRAAVLAGKTLDHFLERIARISESAERQQASGAGD
jgi:glycosyltransferase involved in cell wall biosynthesis